jgi:serine/threonine protein kinase
MTPEHDDGAAEELTYLDVTGGEVRTKATMGPDDPVAPEFLAARQIRLADGTELRQLRVAAAARKPGYQRLDNEILAGLRLWQATEVVGYPPELSRLHGYEATSADPYALLEPYRGEPLTVTGQHLLENEQHQFQVSLLTGLCWLAAAGIAHRGISPATVRWDGRQAQLTDFSMCTVIGAPRQAIGAPPWAAREQRSGLVSGQVSVRDDIWAAGRLIFYVQTREELIDRSQIDERPSLQSLLAGVFGPPEQRPTARELLARLNEPCPVPRALDDHSRLNAGRRLFYAARAGKHPGVAAAHPDDADDAEGPGQPLPPPAAPGQQPAESPRPTRRLSRLFPPATSLIAVGAVMMSAAVLAVPVR